MKIKKVVSNTHKYYLDNFTVRTRHIVDSIDYHLIPSPDVNIDHVKVNDAWIRIYNPHIIIDDHTIKLISNEKDEEQVILIDDYDIGGGLAEVSITVDDVSVENPYVIIWLNSWVPLLNDIKELSTIHVIS